MKRSRSLQLSLVFLKFLGMLLLFLLAVFVIAFVYSLMNPDAFRSVLISNAFQPQFGIGNFRICKTCSGDNLLFLSDLSSSMKVWLLLRGSLFFILTFLIVQKIKSIVRSVVSNTTFYEGNIGNFRTLSYYGLVIAVLSSFNFFIQGDAFSLQFGIPFGVIGFSLACYILSDVFKEGKALAEDKNSIV